jgi:regulator of protease activity HflC (stomatin/prohibitin superfamily)
MNTFLWILVAVVVFVLASLRQINQYERGVMFTMGADIRPRKTRAGGLSGRFFR